jgi:hypothetical protein
MVCLLCHVHKEKGPWPPFMDHLLWLGCFLRTHWFCIVAGDSGELHVRRFEEEQGES